MERAVWDLTQMLFMGLLIAALVVVPLSGYEWKSEKPRDVIGKARRRFFKINE